MCSFTTSASRRTERARREGLRFLLLVCSVPWLAGVRLQKARHHRRSACKPRRLLPRQCQREKPTRANSTSGIRQNKPPRRRQSDASPVPASLTFSAISDFARSVSARIKVAESRQIGEKSTQGAAAVDEYPLRSMRPWFLLLSLCWIDSDCASEGGEGRKAICMPNAGLRHGGDYGTLSFAICWRSNADGPMSYRVTRTLRPLGAGPIPKTGRRLPLAGFAAVPVIIAVRAGN